jgi:hypothetical protein
MQSRNLWVIAGILVLLCVCLCVVVFAVLYSGGYILQRTATEIAPLLEVTPVDLTQAAPLPLQPSATTVPSNPVSPTSPPDASGEIDPQILEQMEEIESQVAQLRGLVSTGPVARSLLTPEELRQRVIDDFFSDYSEAEASDDALVLSLLGLLEPDFDLVNFYIDLFSEQIAGYYDDEVKQMFVVQGEGFHGTERLTYAHEYVHTLQDQVYGFEESLDYTDESCEIDTERCAGIQALVEGDATLLEEEWLQTYATSQDYADILEFFDNFESPVYDSAPSFMRQDFIFPYTYGAEFVREIKRQGGWSAVDAVYANPPISTEQILHPDHYPSDIPISIPVPEALNALGSGWREIERNVIGEWYTQLVLAKLIDPDRASRAAAGWGGDMYVAYANDTLANGALLLIMQWDDAGEASEYADAFTDYSDRRFGRGVQTQTGWEWDSSAGASLFEISGTQTLWILAPDAELRGDLRAAIEFPASN